MDFRGANHSQPARDDFEELTAMQQIDRIKQLLTRRAFLGRSSAGMGMLALASLLKPDLLRGATAPGQLDRWHGVADPLHFAPKAKRVIYLYMAGGPSHLETFDYRPK